MTRDITPDLARIRLFLTEPHSCSYLEKQSATTAFVDPAVTITSDIYGRLSESGFRRSGKYLYIPKCQGCRACIPTRIPVDLFTPSRQQRRCLKRNQDLKVKLCSSIDSDEHFALYERYIHKRHYDGDMFPPSRSQYDDFIGSKLECTAFLEFRLQEQLVGCSVVDILECGTSAIYTYFEPKKNERSLGVFAILAMIELTRSKGIPYLYLGYWISQCQKMSYKVNYQPMELLIDGHWQSFSAR